MIRALAGIVVVLSVAATLNRQPDVRDPEAAVPVYSQALADTLEPGKAPWIATYRSGKKVLCFVAADHVFTPENSTLDAIRRAYADTNPTIVIVEGFPTAFGRNPGQILQSVQQRDAPDADSYARSESAFTASLALSGNVPFMGGEPTLVEGIEGLVAKGYHREDVLFAAQVPYLGHARRSGEMPAGDAAAFTTTYARTARFFSETAGTEPVPEAQFVATYVRIVGVHPVGDAEMPNRSDPAGPESLLQRIAADSMRFRDEHLLSLIQRELAESDRVLVVYGSSHWTTLALTLQERLGKPALQTSF